MVYNALSTRTQSEDIAIHVSYLEIYQEIGYDLLNPAGQMAPGFAISPPKVIFESLPLVHSYLSLC